MMSKAIKFLVIWIGVMFSGIRGFIFLAIVPALLIVVVLAGKIRDVFDRLMSGMLLIFHLFPTVALALNSSLYSMFFPTGIYILLTSPWNPIFVILPRDDPWLRYFWQVLFLFRRDLIPRGTGRFCGSLRSTAQRKRTGQVSLILGCEVSPILWLDSYNLWAHSNGAVVCYILLGRLVLVSRRTGRFCCGFHSTAQRKGISYVWLILGCEAPPISWFDPHNSWIHLSVRPIPDVGYSMDNSNLRLHPSCRQGGSRPRKEIWRGVPFV